MEKSGDHYAVITGASLGLGKAFAYELAQRKTNLILVSLPNQNLGELSHMLIENFNIDVHYFETDLSITDNVIQFSEWINENFDIDILINNAGLGGSKKYIEANVDYINSIIQVNIMATSILTRKLLPNLMKRDNSYILNVSSMAAFNPIGYKTVYPASKAFVHSFSRGLYQELKNTNVFVSVVNPGAIKTNPEVTQRIERQGFLGRLTLAKPEKIAKICINRLLKRDSVIMVNKFSWAMLAILPIWIKLPLLTNVVKREVQ